MAFTTITLPLSLIYPTFFVCILYYLVGFRSDPARFIGFLGIMLLSTNTAAALGQLISATTGNYSILSTMTITIVIPFILLGGFYIIGIRIMWWIRWIRYISLFYYGLKLLIINQFEGVTVDCPPGEIPCPFPDDSAIFEAYDVQVWALSLDICILFVLNIVFRIIAFICYEVRGYSNIIK